MNKKKITLIFFFLSLVLLIIYFINPLKKEAPSKSETSEIENIESSKVDLIWFQSNSEGEIIDKLHWAIDNQIAGVIINPGAYTHYSYAIRDAISSIEIPTIEVHLSNINKRENFRKISVIEDVCIKQIKGKGKK